MFTKNSSKYQLCTINLLTSHSILVKFLKKKLNIKLSESIDKQNIISSFQFGFISVHSMCHKIQRLIETKEFLINQTTRNIITDWLHKCVTFTIDINKILSK